MIILQSRRINHGIMVHVMSCHLPGSPIVQHFVGKLDDRVSANMGFALGLFMGRPTIICGYMFAYPPTLSHTHTHEAAFYAPLPPRVMPPHPIVAMIKGAIRIMECGPIHTYI